MTNSTLHDRQKRLTWLILLNVVCLCMESLENESWSLHLIWKHMNTYEVPVYWCTWYIWKCLGFQARSDVRRLSCSGNLWVLRLDNNYEWEWKCLDLPSSDQICSDVTPSYALMQSDRRGLQWICNEFKPLPASTNMVVSLWNSFEDFLEFSQ